MYQIIGLSRLLTAFGSVVAAFVAFVAYLAPPSDANAWMSLAVKASNWVGLVFLIVGQTFLFPWLCRVLGRFAGVRKFLPPIDGAWLATMESNWPKVSQQTDDASIGIYAVKTAKVTIHARLFYIRMNLTSDDGYSTSKTVMVSANRDMQDNSVQIGYIYDNKTINPENTDSTSHNGAALLDIVDDEKGLRMVGAYWTNRNWKQGLNTAGIIRLTRE